MTDRDKIKDVLECFEQYGQDEQEQRDRMKEDYEFRALKQWDDELRAAREGDPSGARPCLTMDRTNQHVRQVVNDARQNRPAIKVRPVDNDADIKTADMLQGLTRNIEDISRADIAYDWSLECAATAGLGWFRILTRVVDADGNQEPRIARISNPLSVYAGVDWTEPDGCDIERLIITDRLSRKRFKKMYPDADPCSLDSMTGDENEWADDNTLRVAEYFWIENDDALYLQIDGGEMREQDYLKAYTENDKRPQVRGERRGKGRVVYWRKVSAHDVLSETTFPAAYIPVIPVIGTEIWEGNKRILMGMVRPAMDPQRMYNYGRSAFAELVSLAPKAKWLTPEGGIDGYEDQWQRANSSNDPVLTYRTDAEGRQLPPPQRVMGPDIPVGWAQDMQLSERDLQAAMGQYGPSIGAPSQERSGIAIREKKIEGDTGNFHYIDNLGRSIRHAGAIIVGGEYPGMIPRLYDTKRIQRILGEDGSQTYAEIDPEAKQAYAKYPQQDGKTREVFNPTLGRYDVSVSVGPAYTTRRTEAAAQMTAVVQAAPQILATHGDLIFKSQDWPMAEEFAERFKLLLPPQVMARMQAMAQQIQQLQQALQQSFMQLSQAQQEVQSKQADTQIKAQELRRKEQELAIKARELDIKAADVQAKNAIDVAKLQADLQMRADQQMHEQQAHEGEKEGQEPEDQAQQLVLQQLELIGQAIVALNQKIGAQQTVAVKPVRNESGQIVGGVQVKADGTEVPIQIS